MLHKRHGGLLLALCLSAPLPAQYAAWWKFDNNAGQTATDASGNGNHGRLGTTAGPDGADPVWTVPGRFNSALTFDGLDDLVQAPDSATLSVTGSFTVEAWVRPTAVGSVQFAPVVSKWNDISPDPMQPDLDQRGFFLTLQRFGSALHPRFDISHDGNFLANDGGSCSVNTGAILACTHGSLLIGVNPVPLNTWTHLAGVFNSATRQMTLYVNGQQVAQVTAEQANVFDNAEPVLLGSGMLGSDLQDFFTGQIDEPRIWNIALSGEYVEKLYRLQLLQISKTNTGSLTVPIGAATSTALDYRILIQNPLGTPVNLSGFSFHDVLPAEFDLDGAPVPTGCTVTATQPPGATQGQQPKLEPELLQMNIGASLAAGGSCQVDVGVKTDQNPASSKGKKGPQFEPTSCPAGSQVLLNEGVMVFDSTLLGTPFLVLGPVSPLYLGCSQ